jgi:transposase
MRGADEQQSQIFSYLSPEVRVRRDHPLRAIRGMVDEVLARLSAQLEARYARVGRPSIAPEKLLRAQLLQMLYSIRSERLLMEEMDYNLLFRWFVGLNADDAVWDATVFSKNRDRLLQADVAQRFLAQVVEQARGRGLTSDGTSRWTARCWKPGPARKVFSRRRTRKLCRRTIRAIRR